MRRKLSVTRLDDRIAPVADIYAGVPLTPVSIPAHTAEPLAGSFVYVSPDGLNPDGPTTGAEGSLTNPYTFGGGLAWANGLAAGVVPTLSLRRGTYQAFSNAVDRRMVVQNYPGEQPWLDGSVPVTNWTADTTTVPGRTFWRMGTSGFDPDGAGPQAARSFEFPQYQDYHYIDPAKNGYANSGEAVFVGDGGDPLAPVKQVGLYRKTTGETWSVNVGGVSTPTTYYYRRTSDSKLLAPGGVPATTFTGAAIPGGGSTDADYQAAVGVAANLSDATRGVADSASGLAAEKFFVDYLGHQLYIAADPTVAGRAVRVTGVTVGLYANSSATGTVIRGLGFTRYARTGLMTYSCEGLVLDSNAATWNGYAGLTVNGADTVARGNVAVANGQSGLDGSGDRLLGENNSISYSNVERYATNWSAAGWKVTNRDDMVFRNNTFVNNYCTSLWMDVNVRRAFVVNNTADNGGIGGTNLAYFSEISDSNTIAFNVASNMGNGVLVSGSSHNRVFNNTFVDCSTPVQIKESDRTNDVNEDGGAVGGGGAFEGDPYEGGEDDKEAALGSDWEAYDNEVYNNLFADTVWDRLIDLSSTQDPYNAGDPLPNSRATGRPFDSRTMLAGMDFNGYHTAQAADRFILWDPGLAADVVYGTPAEFETFKAAYGLEQHVPTSGVGQLVFEGVADPFLTDVAARDYRPRSGGPAVGRSVAADTIRAVPADILAAAGRLQPTYLGALPPASADTTPPTVTGVAAQTLPENTASAALAFTVGDGATAAGSLAVVTTSSNLDLLPLAGIALGGGGANRTVTVAPASNQAGTAVVTLTVSDAAGNRTTTTFRLTVTVVNPRAGFTSGGSTSRAAPTVGAKDTPLAIPFVLTNAAAVTATSWGEEFVPQANLAWSGTGATRTLTLTPLPGTTGILSLDVVAANAAGATTTRRVYVDFRAADGNRAPRIHTLLNRGLPVATTTGRVEYTVNDLEQPTGAGLVVTAASSDALLVPAANITLGGETDSHPDSRWVQVTPAAGRSGVAVVTLTVRDNGADGVAGNADDALNTRRFTLFINSVPTGVTLSNVSVAENLPAGTVVGTLAAADPGPLGDSFTFALVVGPGSADNGRFQVVGDQLRLAGPLDFEAQATYTVRVRVTDFLGATAEQVLAVTATDVNEPPTLTGGGGPVGLTVPEGTLALLTVTAADPDANPGLQFSLAGGVDQARFQIGAASGALRFVAAPAFLSAADADADNVYQVVVRVTDGGGLSATQAVSVRVGPGVNGGAAQRSRVTALTATVGAAGAVFGPGAVTLTRQSDGLVLSSGGANPRVAVAAATAGGQTVAAISFLPATGSAAGVEAGSLADGVWVLRVDHTRVTGMTADATTPAAGPGRLARLFGDTDGDADVDNGDFVRFRPALGASTLTNPAPYRADLDWDGDGDIDNGDFTRFRPRLGTNLP